MPYGSPAALCEEVALICHPTVPIETLSMRDVQKIYRGLRTRWNDEKRIFLVISKDREVSDIFIREYIGKSSSQFITYWKKRVFSGKSLMPKMAKTEEDVIRYVAQTPWALGYVSASHKLNNVKTISVIK